MSVWYLSSGLSWTQYLQTQSFVRDITGEIRRSGNNVVRRASTDAREHNRRLRNAISDQTLTLVASNQQLARTFESGFDQLTGTVEWGFSRIEDAISYTNSSIRDLNASFTHQMGLLLSEIQLLHGRINDLLQSLDSIHQTLRNPTTTKAREFYRIGCERLSKGLLDKALESFLQAERLNDSDFFTEYAIGKLYLYGVKDECDIVNLSKAREHLLSAARYGKADAVTNYAMLPVTAESYWLASFAIYANIAEANSDVKRDLHTALDTVEKAIALCPDLLEAHYHKAKYCALLSNAEECLRSLETAIRADRKYAIKVDFDADFDTVRNQVLDLIGHLGTLAAETAHAKLAETRDKFLVFQKHYESLNKRVLSESKIRPAVIKKIADQIRMAESSLSTGTYFGSLDALEAAAKIDQDTRSLDEVIQRLVKQQKEATTRDAARQAEAQQRWRLDARASIDVATSRLHLAEQKGLPRRRDGSVEQLQRIISHVEQSLKSGAEKDLVLPYLPELESRSSAILLSANRGCAADDPSSADRRDGAHSPPEKKGWLRRLFD